MIGGCSLALVQPAANRLLTVGVSAKGMGTAFGFKQAAPPVASTLAGLSVPLVAVTVGWRWSFVGVAVLAALMTFWVRPVRRTARAAPARSERQAGDRTALLLLTVAFGLGTWSSSTVTTFFVISVVERGTSEVAAGIMLALAGALAVLTRVVAGFIADRVPANHLLGCAALVAVGGVGVWILSVAQSVPVQAAAVCLALVGTWGFNGVLWFALMKAYPGSPGAVTGSVAPGALIGSTLGPITFGLIAQNAGYSIAFQSVSIIALLTAIGFVDGNRRIRRMSG